MRWYSIPELLPPVYRQVKSMEAVAQAEDDVLGGVEKPQPSYMELTNQILANFFIQTCDLDTIQYWENLLEIELYGTETIEERRAQIILYLSRTQAITDPYAKQVLKDMFGDGNWVYEHDPDNNLILNIEIYNAIDDKVRRFLQWFCRVCPAHVQWRSGRYEELPTEVYQTLNVQSMNESWGQVRCVAGMAPLVFVDKDTGAITGRAYPNEIVFDGATTWHTIESEGVIFAGVTGQFTVEDPTEIVWAELNPPPAGSVDYIVYFNDDHTPITFEEN